jgi:hypothetical protein
MDKKRAVHIDEDCRSLKGHHTGDVFANCTFEDLNGLTLERCDLSRSKFVTSKLKDALNFTLTLNCLSFNQVEMSELLFDLLLCMLLKTKGNTEKRRKLVDVIGEQRVLDILSAISRLE